MTNPVQAFENALISDRVATRFAMEFDSPEALKKYLKEHPDADRSKHSVKKDAPEGDKPAKSETFTPTRHHKELGGKLQQWQGPGTPAVNTVGSYLTSEKAVPRKKLMEAADELEALTSRLNPKDKQDKKDLKDLKGLISHLKNLHDNG